LAPYIPRRYAWQKTWNDIRMKRWTRWCRSAFVSPCCYCLGCAWSIESFQLRLWKWWRQKKVGELIIDYMDANRQALTSSIRESWSSSQNGMQLKILLLSHGFKLSNSKPGCTVSAIHYLWKRSVSIKRFWHTAHSDQCSFSFSFQDEHLFHCWKANPGSFCYVICVRVKKCNLSIYSLWFSWLILHH
jgi:hypothetical protein